MLIIATGSRSFMPPIEGLRTDDGELLPGVFAFRTIDDTRGMIDYAQHEDHRRAVVIGGGLLGLEAARGLQAYGLQVDVVHAGPHLMNAQIGPAGGEILRKSVETLGIEVHTKARTTAIMGEDKVRGVWLLDHPLLECDMVVVAAGIRPNIDLAVTSGLHRGAGHRRRRPDAHDGRPGRLRGRRVRRSTAARSTAWSRRCGSRPWCWPTRSPAPTRTPPTTGRGPPPSSRWPASTSRRWACRGRSGTPTSTSSFSEPQPRGLQVAGHPGRASSSAQRCSATRRKVAFLMQAFDRGLPLPEERLEMLFDLGTPAAGGRRRRTGRRRAGLQLQRRLQGRAGRLRGKRRQVGRRA